VRAIQRPIQARAGVSSVEPEQLFKLTAMGKKQRDSRPACIWCICTLCFSRTKIHPIPTIYFAFASCQTHMAHPLACFFACSHPLYLAQSLGPLVLQLRVEQIAAADGGDVVACLLHVSHDLDSSSGAHSLHVGSLSVCRLGSQGRFSCIAGGELSLHTVPPEVATRSTKTCVHCQLLYSQHSHISMSLRFHPPHASPVTSNAFLDRA